MSTTSEDNALTIALEQRADFITNEEISAGTAGGDFFQRIIDVLLKRQTTLIVGPRGCGKTHMMRYTHILCRDDKSQPFAIYVSFNRYFWLEPMLTSRANAVGIFHAWVLARIILAAYEAIKSTNDLDVQAEIGQEGFGLDSILLEALVAKIERSLPLSSSEEQLASELTIRDTQKIINNFASLAGRPRSILLLDDAALTLTPEYMVEFFDIFRTIKSANISPKASVYPGTTEYGARYHPSQEGGLYDIWLSVENSLYEDTMDAIAKCRIENFERIPEDIRQYLKYAAFGIPRAYLQMLQDFNVGDFRTSQQGLNRLIQTHVEARRKEFRSLILKAPKLKQLIETGEILFDKILRDFKKFNDDLVKKGSGTKQLTIGISDINEYPMISRMINLLVEAGLLYPLIESVSHGAERNYDRYIPHIAALLSLRVFSGNERGSSPRVVVDTLKLKSSKQPLRRKISTLLSAQTLSSLQFDLPPCGNCGTPRALVSQKFCHNCGAELLDRSTFEGCMSLPLHEVPRLTRWQVERMKSVLPNFKTIGDLLSLQDPGTELRRIHRVGQVRAENIIRVVTGFVDEFLQ